MWCEGQAQAGRPLPKHQSAVQDLDNLGMPRGTPGMHIARHTVALRSGSLKHQPVARVFVRSTEEIVGVRWTKRVMHRQHRHPSL